MSRLFAKMLARYGNRWSQQWPSDELRGAVMAEWGQILAGVTLEQIKHGLDAYTDDWPPTAHQFRKACVGGGWEHRGKAYKVFPTALPAPKAKADTVKQAMDAMRENIRGGRSLTEQERLDGIEREKRRLRELNGEAK